MISMTLSMWISNTAVAAMLLPIVRSLLIDIFEVKIPFYTLNYTFIQFLWVQNQSEKEHLESLQCSAIETETNNEKQPTFAVQVEMDERFHLLILLIRWNVRSFTDCV